jgi:hypothetical protein
LVKTDPTIGVKNLPRPRGDGFVPWTEEHVAAYEERPCSGKLRRDRDQLFAEAVHLDSRIMRERLSRELLSADLLADV